MVAENMDHGQEKSLAILNTAACHEKLGDIDTATRYYKMALLVPDIAWSDMDYGRFELWTPMSRNGYFVDGTTYGIARYRLSSLNNASK